MDGTMDVTGAAPALLDDWDRFIETTWERRPAVLRMPEGRPLIEPPELLEAMRAAADDWRAGGRRTFSMWADGTLLRSYDAYLPLASDATLPGYLERVMASPGGMKEFAFSQNNLHLHHPAIWRKARAFVRGLIERVGVPTDGVDCDTFLGAYRATPLGVHSDGASTFMMVLHGRKTMAVWPGHHFSDKGVRIVGSGLRRTIVEHDPTDALRDAVILSGEPGDVLYWPSTYWHTAISGDPPPATAVFNIGLFFGAPESSLLSEVVGKALKRALAGFEDLHTYPLDLAGADAPPAPQRERDALRLFRGIVLSEHVDAALQEWWCKRVSAVGFREVPPPRAATLAAGAARLDPGCVLLWQVAGQHVKVFANGHALSVPHTPALLELLPALRAGVSVPLGAGAAAGSGLARLVGDASARAALEHLHALDALIADEER
ncbi:hypothetical protein AB3662_01085 [Sorangium cellulosum]|uniref:hypothetical protein n=1 Tax=Sorangium cellulosum TaxID=56 RepID=UPI003D9A2DC3